MFVEIQKVLVTVNLAVNEEIDGPKRYVYTVRLWESKSCWHSLEGPDQIDK